MYVDCNKCINHLDCVNLRDYFLGCKPKPKHLHKQHIPALGSLKKYSGFLNDILPADRSFPAFDAEAYELRKAEIKRLQLESFADLVFISAPAGTKKARKLAYFKTPRISKSHTLAPVHTHALAGMILQTLIGSGQPSWLTHASSRHGSRKLLYEM